MASNKKYTVRFRRRRLGKTDYRARLRLLLGRKVRLVVRRTLNNILAQLVTYDNKGDKILINLNASILKKYGWKYHLGNLPSAYLTGLLVGVQAKKKKIKEVVLDIGLHQSVKSSSLYTLVKGALDSGLLIKCDEKVLPSYDRISGKHIAEYALKIKNNQALYNKQFSQYIKNNVNLEDLPRKFEEVKTKILQENA